MARRDQRTGAVARLDGEVLRFATEEGGEYELTGPPGARGPAPRSAALDGLPRWD